MIVAAGDGAFGELDERIAVEAGEPARPFAVEAVHRAHRVAPGVALCDLEAGQRRESLQLDQLRNQRAVFADDGEIDLREARQRVHARRVPARRNGAFHLCDAGRIGELRHDGSRGVGDGALEVVRQKQWRLG